MRIILDKQRVQAPPETLFMSGFMRHEAGLARLRIPDEPHGA